MDKLNHLFQIQTSILLNHVFSNLLKLFMNPNESQTYLYTAIIPTKSISKEQLKEREKSIPNLLKYEIWATKTDSKLIFTLFASPLPPFEIYTFNLYQSQPKVSFLKKISAILVSKYRPLPTKVDKEFSVLSKKYFEYLDYNKAYRRWNSGVPAKEKSKIDVENVSKQDIEKAYISFAKDINTMHLKYRAFTKVLIDIYKNNKELRYLGKHKNVEIYVKPCHNHDISILIDYLHINRKEHEIITLSSFHPATTFSNTRLISVIVSCLTPLLEH